MKILRKKEDYLAPYCEFEFLETEDCIAAGSQFSSDDDVPPVEDENWGTF